MVVDSGAALSIDYLRKVSWPPGWPTRRYGSGDKNRVTLVDFGRDGTLVYRNGLAKLGEVYSKQYGRI